MPKSDLVFEPPLMNAAGSLGFSPDLHLGLDWSGFGAFITHPLSLEPRTPANGVRFIPCAGGFLLHTGYPNPGLSSVLRRYVRQWSGSPVPIIVHLLAGSPTDVERMARRLETLESVVGVELGVDSDATSRQVSDFTRAAAGEMAVMVRLPMERALELARAALDAGASLVSLAPPRGVYPDNNGRLVQGRLYGPSVLPLGLRVVEELHRAGVPVIGAGGVYAQAHMDAMLKAGARAVQVDSLLWRGAGYQVFA